MPGIGLSHVPDVEVGLDEEVVFVVEVELERAAPLPGRRVGAEAAAPRPGKRVAFEGA